MSEVILKDESIHEINVNEMHVPQTTPQGSQADFVESGHEHRDIDVRAVLLWFAGLLAMVVGSYLVVLLTFQGFYNFDQRADTTPSALYRPRESNVPISKSGVVMREYEENVEEVPGENPVLLAYPDAPMDRLKEAENERLNNYGYVKDDKGRVTGVHIPIDKAMDDVVEEEGRPKYIKSPGIYIPPKEGEQPSFEVY